MDDFRAKNPHLAKFWPYLDLLNKESHRGKVLISTGFLEQQLKDMLLAFMIEGVTANELLDGGNAPLGSFSSRISTCYVLGLISETEYHDLNLIRRIRNDFAHHIETNFETQSVMSRCALLKMKAQDYTSEKMGDVKVDAAGQFQTAAVSLIMNLTNRAHYASVKRAQYGNWSY